MIEQATIDEAREHVLSLAPELRQQEFYAFRNPPDLHWPSDALAFATSRCEVIRDYLQWTGSWRGEGVFAVFSESHPDDRESVFGTMLHEACHLLPHAKQVPYDALTTAELLHKKSVYEQWAAAPNDPTWRPWRGHGAHFTRRLVHMWFRSLLAGVSLPLERLTMAGPRYQLTPAFRYVESLGSEPFAKRRWTFREIQESEPPRAFFDLYKSDVEKWEAKQQRTNTEAA